MPLQMQLLRFLCIAKMNFDDTDLIWWVTAQMSCYSNWLIKCKNLTQKIMQKMVLQMVLQSKKIPIIGKKYLCIGKD